MQFIYWFVLLIAIGFAIFAIQNSGAVPITLRFLFWKFETSLIYALLGSTGVGLLIVLALWIPRAIHSSVRSRERKKEIENLERMVYGPSPSILGKGRPGEER